MCSFLQGFSATEQEDSHISFLPHLSCFLTNSSAVKGRFVLLKSLVFSLAVKKHLCFQIFHGIKFQNILVCRGK